MRGHFANLGAAATPTDLTVYLALRKRDRSKLLTSKFEL
jgi:hypothetical protein